MRNNTHRLAVPTLCFAFVVISAAGCATDAPGIKSNYVQQWTTVGGNVEAATAAAAEVLEEYEFKNVESQTTRVDGRATANKADGEEITVDVRRVDDDASEVTVRVGTTGDGDLGIELVQKIFEEFED
ncbi:MAG: DUF3568 family protein [Planctomycetota bacterium]